MRIIRLTANDYLRMPWKNAGGETLQMAIYPHDATLDSFGWRVSSAQVGVSGPFSAFPGVDRSLAVLDGGSLSLTIAEDDGRPASLQQIQPGEQPLVFRGETPIDCSITPGSRIRDLNVMTRREQFSHRMEKRVLLDSTPIEGQMLLFYCQTGSAGFNLEGDQTAFSVKAGEVLIVEAADHQRFELTPQSDVGSTLWCIWLWPVGPHC